MFDAMGVRRDFLRVAAARPTPVCAKPVVVRPERPPEELDRFDVFPRDPLGEEEEAALLDDVRAAFEAAHVLVVSDCAERGKEGTVTPRVRELVVELARKHREKPVLVDSRLHIDRFRDVVIKPNAREAMAHLTGEPDAEPGPVRLTEIGRRTAERNRRPVLITLGRDGLLVCAANHAQKVPTFRVDGETDAVGAGDTVLAAVAAGLAAGAALDEAAVLAMIAASLVVEQIGTCGAAAPGAIRARFPDYAAAHPDTVSP